MKKPTYKLNDRIPIWISLSEFYLDTELDVRDFRNIVLNIRKSPYSLEEIKWINKYEVFPVLQSNLLNVAGEWAGFNEEWLIEKITQSISKRNLFTKMEIEISYKMHKWMCKEYWEKLEKQYGNFENTES